MTNAIADQLGRLSRLRGEAVAALSAQDQGPDPSYARQCELNAFNAEKRAAILKAEAAANRPLIDGETDRLADLSAHMAALRDLQWDGEGERPTIPRLPAFRGGGQTRREAPTRSAGRSVSIGGKAYSVVPADALALFGALAMALDGETARITLASGDVLELTHQEVSDLGRQLAGTPADEVSG